jgi:glycosyltransferase involved in cell wall biosynthesis
MKVIYVYADSSLEWNCSEWRCAVPERAINRAGRNNAEMLSIADFGENTPAAQALCESADVIVVQRNLFGPVLSAIQHWKARDKVVIADFDDAYNLMPPDNVSYPFWSQGILNSPDGKPKRMDPLPLTQFKWGLRLVHAGTVPSKRLADDWQSFTEMHYLPNFIDLKYYENITYQKHEGVIIGWGGSLSHLQSFSGSGVMTALKRVCRARPQVKVMICGSDRRIVEHLSLPHDRIIYRPWVPYNEWAQVLANFDIGIAPLYGSYDERRSWIKVLEYMVMKIPWVASEGPAYQDLRAYGWLVKNTPSSWERVLLDIVDHLGDYKNEASGDPYLFGISQSVDENVNKILSTYASIYERVMGNVLKPSPSRFSQSILNY